MWGIAFIDLLPLALGIPLNFYTINADNVLNTDKALHTDKALVRTTFSPS